MSTKQYETILGTFDEISAKTQDDRVDSIAAWTRASIEEIHKPTIALVSFNLNHIERFRVIKQFFGVEIPEEIVAMTDWEPICMILDYNESPALLNNGRNAGRQIWFGLPYESLKELRIAICDEVSLWSEWLELSNEIDMACLVINATMAMNQMERNWLQECGISFFEESELVLAITRMEQLNDNDDIQAVHKVVADSLKRIGASIKVFEKMEEALKWMTSLVQREDIQEKHDRRVVKNGIKGMTSQLKKLLDRVMIDSATIQSTADQLNRQQKDLESAGQFVVESILSNALNRLKIQLCDGIRDYGRQMAANIKKKIADVPLDQLETMDDKINRYISGSWEYYIKSMSVKAEAEMEVIAQKLAKQLETDVGMLISGLDESARRTVYRALGLIPDQMKTAGLTLVHPLTIIHDQNALTEVSVGTITDQLRKEIRNMMLISIPLFFVNPLLSVGSILVSGAYGKIKTNRELKDILSEMAEQTERACFHNAESIVHRVEENFNDEIQAGSIHIQSVYRNLIQQIENRLIELNNSQEAKIALQGYLNDQITVVFPDFRANL